ncbi:SGNH/GDSL hydrolase family protein [Actinoplanes sp. DH11]|uniref:SGNH/GDSL hydrolase family protein n=1 Tax=Actinoplanes sp. DH11 TaxID=2857011 RepID=UPI001E31D4BC|nr:SGNH/GDSL hydrolase family protein [Actinoplanes sp. DH11]
MPDRLRRTLLNRATTRRALLLGGTGAAVLAATPGTAGQRNPVLRVPNRVGTWAAPVTAQAPRTLFTLADHTVRQVIHTSVGGDQPRVRLSNEFGATPVPLGAVHLALRAGTGASSAIIPGTDRPLTFAGRPEAVIPAGGTLISDAADLIVPAGSDLVISLYLPERTEIATVTARALQTNRLVPGNRVAETDVDGKAFGRYIFLAGVDVRARRSTTAIVAFGDSITCGVHSQENANHRWPDLFAARLRGEGLDYGVLNVGISGNRVLTGPAGRTGKVGGNAFAGESGLRRFDRDVLAQPGASHVIVLHGVNDLGRKPSADVRELIDGHRELIARGHAAGLKMIGGTMLPFAGFAHFDNARNRKGRDTFNAWLRDAREYDAIIDFDRALRDPAAPHRLAAAYDSGDHLHPDDRGMAALAAAVPLDLFP